MPRYFLNLTDGHNSTIDEVGENYASLAAAELEAIRTLSDVVRDEMSSRKVGTISVQLVNEDVQTVLTATLDFSIVRTSS